MNVARISALRTTLRSAGPKRTFTNLAPRRSPHGRGEPGMGGENPSSPGQPGGAQPMKRSNNGLKVATGVGVGAGALWYMNRSRRMRQPQTKAPAA